MIERSPICIYNITLVFHKISAILDVNAHMGSYEMVQHGFGQLNSYTKLI
jgi:hypothetical protein